MHLKIYDTHKITVLCVCGQLFNIWGQTGKMWLWRLTWVERVCVRGLWGWPCPGRSGGQPVNPRLKTQTTRLVNKLGYTYIMCVSGWWWPRWKIILKYDGGGDEDNSCESSDDGESGSNTVCVDIWTGSDHIHQNQAHHLRNGSAIRKRVHFSEEQNIEGPYLSYNRCAYIYDHNLGCQQGWDA